MNSRNGYRERTWDTRMGTNRPGHPQAAVRQLLPGLAVGAAPPVGAGPGGGGGRVLSRRRLHPPGRGAGPDPGHRAVEQVPSQRHGPGAGPDGDELPQPATGPRRQPLPLSRRPHPAGPQGRPDRQRRRGRCHRGDRRGEAGDPRCDVVSAEVEPPGQPCGGPEGPGGVRLVTSDTHDGFKNAIAAVLGGASWQR